MLQNIPDTEPESPRILQDYEQTFSSPFHTPITLRQVEKLSDDIEERLEGIDEALVDDILEGFRRKIKRKSISETGYYRK